MDNRTKPQPGVIRTAKPHLRHAAIKGAASLLHKHGHIDAVTYGDIVKHSDRNMKKSKSE